MLQMLSKLRDSVFVIIFTALLIRLRPKPSAVDYFIIFCILTFFLNFVFPGFNILKRKYISWQRMHFPKVGILNGSLKSRYGEFVCERRWSEITPAMWFHSFKKEFKKFPFRELRLIALSEIDDSWSIIINPFGENYPEENTRLRLSFNKICEYINNGGIFVVSAGAFFYQQNTRLSAEAKRAITHVEDGIQSLDKSLLAEDFGVNYTGNVYQNGALVFEEPVDVEVYQNNEEKNLFGDLLSEIKLLKRFRATTSGTSSYLAVVRQKGKDKFGDKEIFPISVIPYGKGGLIHAGLHLTSLDSNEFKLDLCKMAESLDR